MSCNWLEAIPVLPPKVCWVIHKAHLYQLLAGCQDIPFTSTLCHEHYVGLMQAPKAGLGFNEGCMRHSCLVQARLHNLDLTRCSNAPE